MAEVGSRGEVHLTDTDRLCVTMIALEIHRERVKHAGPEGHGGYPPIKARPLALGQDMGIATEEWSACVTAANQLLALVRPLP